MDAIDILTWAIVSAVWQNGGAPIDADWDICWMAFGFDYMSPEYFAELAERFSEFA